MSKKKPRQRKIDPFRSLAVYLAEDYRTMQNLYGKSDAQGLARFLEQRAAVLVTPDYKRIQGGASAKIWKSYKEKKVKLKLRPVNIFFGNAIGLQKLGGNTFDNVAFVVHEVHFIEKTGPAPRNATGYLVTIYGHDVLCPWFPAP